MPKQTAPSRAKWLLLIHQLPPEPNYLRVKVSRRLARVGAVQLKSTVYALPEAEACHEDFLWIRRELIDSGGEATIFAATVVEGLSDAELKALFKGQRDQDYATVERDLAELAKKLGRGRIEAGVRSQATADLSRIARRLLEIRRIDFFDEDRGQRVRARVEALHARLSHGEPSPQSDAKALDSTAFRKRAWVTRSGIKVDRIASAWLIRRFIDGQARFRFVALASYEHKPRELRFDMADGEFTHMRDLCTFEVLCDRFQLEDKGLRAIGEIVHDLDIKDGRYGRPDNEGVATLIQGLVAKFARDEERLESGVSLFDALYASFTA